MPDRITAGRGAYWRDDTGRWRYTCSGEAVPGAVDVPDGKGGICMMAPELAPELLLGTPDVAKRFGVSVGYVSAELTRGRMPTPPVKVSHCPAWTAPIADWWWEHGRPGRGAYGKGRPKRQAGAS
jgi:hypothetical protein